MGYEEASEEIRFGEPVEFEELDEFDDEAELELLAARVSAARAAGV